jgi:hypothetical protein
MKSNINPYSLNKSDLSDLIRDFSNGDDTDRIITRRGVGRGKALVKWAKDLNLLTKKCELTEECKVLLANDPYFTSKVTNSFLAYHFTKIAGFNQLFFMAKKSCIKVVDLLFFLERNFGQKQISKINLFLKSCQELNLLTYSKDFDWYDVNYEETNVYMLGYRLSQVWARTFKDTGSVLMKELECFDRMFDWDNLQLLTAKGIVEMWTTVDPYTVVKRWCESSLDFLKKAYNPEPVSEPVKESVKQLGNIDGKNNRCVELR